MAARTSKSGKQARRRDSAPAATDPSPDSKRDKQGKFVPGVSGNPDGRPKGSGKDVEFRSFLRQTLSAPEWRDEIVSRMHESPQFLMWAADQAFGKARQSVDMTMTQELEMVDMSEAARSLGMDELELIDLLLSTMQSVEIAGPDEVQ